MGSETETAVGVSGDGREVQKQVGTEVRVARRSSERLRSRSSEAIGSCTFNTARCHSACVR